MQVKQSGVLFDALPPILQNISELEKICEIEQEFFNEAWQAVQQVLNEQFAYSCTAYGLSRMESLLGITPRQGAEDYERVQTILFRQNEQLPFTFAKLKELLALISPEEECRLELDYDNMSLTLDVTLSCKRVERLLKQVLSRVLPANISWDLQWQYNTNAMIGGYTHADLAKMTHYAMREEVLS